MKGILNESRMALLWILAMPGLFLAAPAAHAQLIPASAAFDKPPVCSASDLANNADEARINPEWKRVLGLAGIDADHLVLDGVNDPPTILEGFVPFPPADESSGDQATSEVAEEDIPWNHYTHDFTFKVVPDFTPTYQSLLSSWVRFKGTTFTIDPNDPLGVATCFSVKGFPDDKGTTCTVPPETCPDGSTGETCHHTEMEVEWENAALMAEHEGSQRTFGAVPEFVWPAAGDRVWVAGRWIFDCGHPNVPPAQATEQMVQFSTEIHPPRALVTIRLNHPALDSFPRPRVSAPNFPGPQSFLPVTGVPVTLPPDVSNSGPTNVAVTEADIFVSGNGGGANDLCMLLAVEDKLGGGSCKFGHTTPVAPVNTQNYVFDIYPPATDYSHTEDNGTFRIFPPTSDASLQFRIEDHFSELPTHACGGDDTSNCKTVNPIFCLIDAKTPPPDQTETGCPDIPADRPTRLRVILPFKDSAANFFAKSILLGWDDVPFNGSINFAVRNFKITLHSFKAVNTRTGLLRPPVDWRLFVNVAGQHRFMNPTFDRDADGHNVCRGAGLDQVNQDDCFQFDQTPFFVSVQIPQPIHVAVGGFQSEEVDGDFCRQFPAVNQCDPFGLGDLFDLAFHNDERIGTYEFDLREARNYQWVNLSDGTPITEFTTEKTADNQYSVKFVVEEIPPATPPTSSPLQLGDPHFDKFVSSATPVLLASTSPGVEGFQYRSFLQGGPLPVFPASDLQFPLHWTHASLPAGAQSVPVFLTGTDGTNLLQFSANSVANLLEPRHTETLVLDNTPPVINIVQPAATTYLHTDVLTLDYTVSDGTGSGVASFIPAMDGATSLPGGVGLQNGQAINLLTELKAGTHTFTISARDNLNNASTASVTFKVIVTPKSIIDDVNLLFQAGAIKNSGLVNTFIGDLNSAADARNRGQCNTAGNVYASFINDVQSQRGKGVSTDAADIMIADAQFLIANCP